MDKKHLLDVLERFKGMTVAVAGDLLADLYVFARPVGLSREAPVMVLAEESQRVTPGGAANAACNVLALGAKTFCLGVLGDDPPGRALAVYLAQHGADSSGTVIAKDTLTTTKMRVFAGDVHTVKQQVFRLDRYPASRMAAHVESQVLAAIDKCADSADVWLVSDYNGDFFSDRVIARFNELAAAKPMVVDSHRRLLSFKGVTCATPNEGEAALAAGMSITDDDSAREAGRIIRDASGDQWVFITRGNKGMALLGPDGRSVKVPVVGPTEIVDVTGAGDTVSAVVALALALGEDPVTAAVLATYAASIVVMRTGVATPTPEELKAVIEKYPLPL